MEKKSEIILYEAQDNNIALDVLFKNETVWLTQSQMGTLFDRDRTVINRHIRNIFEEGELNEKVSSANFAHDTLHGAMTGKMKISYTNLYNLDVIISVGYRVKSQRGTRFRQWANKILKDYILKGYAIHERFERLENRVTENEKKIDFFVRTSLPPVQGVFFEGQIFDAFVFASNLIKSAKKSVVLIDNYIDETVLLLLSKRQTKVSAEIYTKQISAQIRLDLNKHNTQYKPINIKEITSFHDRFLIIDEVVYHLGASLKDLGKKLFAFSKMEIKYGELSKNI